MCRPLDLSGGPHVTGLPPKTQFEHLLPHRAALMNPKPFHTPVSTRVSCPVCHQTVYSRSGIHPQCAVRQSDPPRSKAKPPVDPVIAESAGADEAVATSSAESISPSE